MPGFLNLTNLIVVIEVLSSIGLIFSILLHSGKGGGLSGMFGGPSQVAAGSTVMDRNLDRITVALVLVFAFASLSLALRWQ